MPKHWVPPFGDLRVKRLFAANRSLSQRTTSFIACNRQGIHQVPLCFLRAYVTYRTKLATQLMRMNFYRVSLNYILLCFKEHFVSEALPRSVRGLYALTPA